MDGAEGGAADAEHLIVVQSEAEGRLLHLCVSATRLQAHACSLKETSDQRRRLFFLHTPQVAHRKVSEVAPWNLLEASNPKVSEAARQRFSESSHRKLHTGSVWETTDHRTPKKSNSSLTSLTHPPLYHIRHARDSGVFPNVISHRWLSFPAVLQPPHAGACFFFF